MMREASVTCGNTSDVGTPFDCWPGRLMPNRLDLSTGSRTTMEAATSTGQE